MATSDVAFNTHGFHMDAEEAEGVTHRTGSHRRKALSTLRRREAKWLGMLDQTPPFSAVSPEKLRSRVAKGIPNALRGRAWTAILINGDKLGPHLEADLIRSYQPAESEAMFEYFETIDKDLHRTFPKHELFGELQGLGQSEMRDMLRMYAYHHDPPGYCQGMAMVAGVLLMHQLRDDAYLSLCQLLRKDKYLLGMFDQGLPRVQILTATLDVLIEETWPDLHTHMQTQGLQALIYAVDWFMCIFAKTLPWDVVLRVWDMFFFDGFKVSLRVAYEIIRLLKPRLMTQCPGIQELMTTLRNIPREVAQESVLLAAVLKSKLKESTIDRALAKAGYVPQPDRPHPAKRDPPARASRVVNVQPPTPTQPQQIAVSPVAKPDKPSLPAIRVTSEDPHTAPETAPEIADVIESKAEAVTSTHMHTVDIDAVVQEDQDAADPANEASDTSSVTENAQWV
eukprot:m.129940 g.129940  ORF g.129940 m.129940 type:complete len:453 (-) comp15864_c0_seq1:1323-2681(-)